jgi:hypothetical protein
MAKDPDRWRSATAEVLGWRRRTRLSPSLWRRALGLRYLETGIRLTRDGHPGCFHDETLQGVRPAPAWVRNNQSFSNASA